MSLKKKKRRRIKKSQKILVHKSDTDDGKLDYDYCQGSVDSYFGELC